MLSASLLGVWVGAVFVFIFFLFPRWVFQDGANHRFCPGCALRLFARMTLITVSAILALAALHIFNPIALLLIYAALMFAGWMPHSPIFAGP